MAALSANDHYAYAFVAVVGTAFAVWLIDRAMRGEWSGPWIASLRGVVPPFINIVGVLFGLTLAFLANDTWNAHERTSNAVYREADSLRSLTNVAEQIDESSRMALRTALRNYRDAAVDEWRHLAGRASNPAAQEAGDALLSLASSKFFADSTGPTLHELVLRKVVELRADRDARISLSQTHVNPLKWLGMAFLGFVTLMSVAVVHAENRRAALTAMILFALAASPAAAIVLVQSNPFQQPAAVSPQPLVEALAQS
jgi:hypothetical protein